MVASLTALRNRISLIYGYSGHKVQNGTLFVEGLQVSNVSAEDIEDYTIESTERGTLWHLPSRTSASASANARTVPRHYLRFEAYCREHNITIESMEQITPAGSPKTPREIGKIMEWQDCTSQSVKSQRLLSTETYWYCYTLSTHLRSYNPTFLEGSKYKILLRRQESKKDQRSKLAFVNSLLKLCAQIILDPGLTSSLVEDWEEEWGVEFKGEIERIAGGELSW